MNINQQHACFCKNKLMQPFLKACFLCHVLDAKDKKDTLQIKHLKICLKTNYGHAIAL